MVCGFTIRDALLEERAGIQENTQQDGFLEKGRERSWKEAFGRTRASEEQNGAGLQSDREMEIKRLNSYPS